MIAASPISPDRQKETGLGHSQGRGLAIALAGLVLLAALFAVFRIVFRPGPLSWSTQPVVRLASGQPASLKGKKESDFNALAMATAGQSLGKINPNFASLEELCELPGIGKVLGGRIMTARVEKAFHKPEDLRRVQGIGVKTLDRIRPLLVFEPIETPPSNPGNIR